MEKFNRALDSYKKTLDIEGASPELYCHLGAAYEKLEQYDLALKYYRKATKLDHLYHEAWFGMGISLSLKEKWYEAVHFLQKASKLAPESVLYLKALAEAESKAGNVISALECYSLANRLDPTDPEIWLDWSFIYHEQGDYETAIDLIDAGLSELPRNGDLLYRMATYYISDRKYKDAFHYLELALIIDFEGHLQLYDFFPNLSTQKALFKVIEQYRKNKDA
jgi:tetratricopeptide (TPR) repeat protein